MHKMYIERCTIFCVFPSMLYCYAALNLDPMFFICKMFSLNISSIYITMANVARPYNDSSKIMMLALF